MTPNEDLARWGEPPADEAELALAQQLADTLDEQADSTAGPSAQTRGPSDRSEARDRLLVAGKWIEEMILTVLSHAGLFDNPPLAADSGVPSPTPAGGFVLRLRVFRQVGPSQFQPVASTRSSPMVLRDLKRVPADPDRVALRTGERVRVEVECDHQGYLSVFNIGPAGTVNLLYPASPDEAGAIHAGTPLLIADVELTPPDGRERVYAVWSRSHLALGQLVGLAQPRAVLRDMQRVQDKLADLHPEDWHAVMLDLDHRK